MLGIPRGRREGREGGWGGEGQRDGGVEDSGEGSIRWGEGM